MVAITGIYYLSHNDSVIVFDTGHSFSISNDSSDFITWDNSAFGPTLRGIILPVVIKGSSTVKWIVKNDDEVDQVILTYAHYILDATILLFSPQKHIK